MLVQLAQSIRDKAADVPDLDDGPLVASDILLPLDVDAGTAADLDVPVSGDATSGQVVKGSDTRLTNQRTPTDGSVTNAKIVSMDYSKLTNIPAATDNRLRFGHGVPSNGLGANGDGYLDQDAGTFYEKAAGSWTLQYTDATDGGGADGALLYGSGVPGGGLGSNGDAYINTAAGTFYKKAAGSWTLQYTDTSQGTAGGDLTGTYPNPVFASNVIATKIHAATAKTTPVDADEFGYADSAALFAFKRFSWANIKAVLKGYFDTLYAPLVHTHDDRYYTETEVDGLIAAIEGGTTRTIGSLRDLVHSQQSSGALTVVPISPAIIIRHTEDADHNYHAYPRLAIDRQGRLQCYPQSASANESDDGIIERLVSSDAGKTWQVETLIDQVGYDARSASPLLLTDGRLALAWWTRTSADITAPNWTGNGYVRFSSDDGESWDSDIEIAPGLFDWIAIESLIEVDGVLLITFYAPDNPSWTRTSTYVVRSTDGGAHFSAPILVADGTTDSRDYNEGNFDVWQGKLRIYIREESNTLRRYTSLDLGLTWTSDDGDTPENWVNSFPGLHRIGQALQIFYRATGTAYTHSTDISVSWDGGDTWTLMQHDAFGCYTYSGGIVHDGLLIVTTAYEEGTGASGTSSTCDIELLTYRLGAAVGLNGTLYLDAINLGGVTVSDWDDLAGEVEGDEVDSFLGRTEISDTDIEGALRAFMAIGKADGWWNKMHAIYPLVGGSAATHAENLISGDYQITWSGGLTHNGDGVTGNGSSGDGDTGINASTVLAGIASCSFGLVSSSAGAAASVEMGARTSAPLYMDIIAKWSDNACYADGGGPSGSTVGQATGVTGAGRYIATKDGGDFKLFRDGSAQTEVNIQGTETLPNSSFHLFNDGIGGGYSARLMALAFIGDGLDDTEVGQLDDAIATLMTALGR